MAEYLLIRVDDQGGALIGRVDVDAGRTALGILNTTTDYAYSLVDTRIVDSLRTLFAVVPAEEQPPDLEPLTLAEVLTRLNIADATDAQYMALVIAGEGVDHLSVPIEGAARRLMDLGEYVIWQVTANPRNLRDLHALLWAMPPTQMLGLVAVVQVFGTSFYPSLVRSELGMTITQALARRDRVATYLESQGYSNTAALRAATDEHAVVVGVLTALGRTMTQLWNTMENSLR